MTKLAFALVVLVFISGCKKNSNISSIKQINATVHTKNSRDSLGIARFPGGVEAMKDYITKNMTWQQKSLTVAGNVLISFNVTAEGEITNIKIERSLCDSCDKEAIRLVKAMPKWTPAENNGRKTESKVLIPIEFKLYTDE